MRECPSSEGLFLCLFHTIRSMRRLHVYALLEDGEPVAIMSGKSKADLDYALKARLRSSKARHYEAWLGQRGLKDCEDAWEGYVSAMYDTLPEYSLERIGLGKDFAVAVLAGRLFGDGYYAAKGADGTISNAIKAEPDSPDEFSVNPPLEAQ